MKRRTVLWLAGALCGCARAPVDVPQASALSQGTSPVVAEPIGLQLRKADPELRDVRFNSVLNFEAPSDLVFVGTLPDRSAELDTVTRFTGRSSLHLPADARELKIHLPALVGGREFPGTWKLIGPYVRTKEKTTVVLAYVVHGVRKLKRTVDLAPGTWTPLTLDLTGPGVVGEVGELVLSRVGATTPELWVDDLLLVDNADVLVDTHEAPPEQFPWTITRSGFAYSGEAAGRFSFTLQTPESTPDGWRLVEADAMRCRFVSDGKSKFWTIYADGRAYKDGRFEPVAKLGGYEPQLAKQHQNPADVLVPEDQGRVDRTSDGDQNNDGYNEARGSYVMQATGSRLELRLVPRGGTVYRPMLEITGLPKGDVLVTVEGRLVEHSVRTQDGTLLVDVPVKIERETVVNIRIR